MDLRGVERGAHLVVGDLDAAAAVRAARRQQHGLVGPELRRRADVPVAVDDHRPASPLLIPLRLRRERRRQQGDRRRRRNCRTLARRLWFACGPLGDAGSCRWSQACCALAWPRSPRSLVAASAVGADLSQPRHQDHRAVRGRRPARHRRPPDRAAPRRPRSAPPSSTTAPATTRSSARNSPPAPIPTATRCCSAPPPRWRSSRR